MHHDLTRISLLIALTAGAVYHIAVLVALAAVTREMRSFAVTRLSGWFQAHLLST
jgi:hypothetical protein